jgi:cell wall-associated NlpC family hydrolase
MFAGRTLMRTVLCAAAAVVVLLPASAAMADPSLSEIQAQIDKANNEVELVIEAYNKINGDLAATQQQINQLDTQMKPMLDEVNAASANVNEIAVTAYKTGSSLRNVSILLSAGSSDSFMDRMTTLQQLSKSQQKDISKYANDKKAYDNEHKRLADLLAAQNAQKAELETKKATIDGQLAQLDALQKKAEAAGAKPPKANISSGPAPQVSGLAGKAVDYAWAKRGSPYKYGASGPSQFDCSGLTMAAWKAAGVQLPHNAAQQWSKVAHISRSQLAPGDLVFYNGLGHVAIYIGNNKVIHAPHTGTVVQEASVDIDSLYGYGRVRA